LRRKTRPARETRKDQRTIRFEDGAGVLLDEVQAVSGRVEELHTFFPFLQTVVLVDV
jgi:hypothetical protein